MLNKLENYEIELMNDLEIKIILKNESAKYHKASIIKIKETF